MSEKIDLGDGCSYEFTHHDRSYHPSAPDNSGIIFWHPVLPGKPGIGGESDLCGGSVFWWRPIEDTGPMWRVIMEAPMLTLEPSIRCHCGFHGWIRDGRWVAA